MADIDTAQPSAAETEPLNRNDAIANAADAFKVALGQEEAPRPRNEKGQFASQVEEQEIETDEEEAEAEPEADDTIPETDEDEEAAEEAQPTTPAMPVSWNKEDSELWNALPPEVQGKIAEREGQRDAAVNQKFQESANVKRAAEAAFAEAQANRANYTQALDSVLQLIQPQWPSASLLDINSDDYDPDSYHLMRAQAEQGQALVNQLATQRQQVAAQASQEETIREQQAAFAINQATLPAFEQAYPDVMDAEKAKPFLAGLMQFASEQGAPPEFFNGTVTAVEWHIIADAKQWRDHKAALQKVKAGKPEPRKAQPAIRPGVATPKSAVQKAQYQKDRDRLARTGSVEAGAAIWKHHLKGS
jgi:hypothetical protein